MAKIDKIKVIAAILAVLLVAAVIYIGSDKYSEFKAKKENDIKKQGYDEGFDACMDQVSFTLLNDLQTRGYTQISFPDGNNETQTVTLVPYVPEEQQMQYVPEESTEILETE